jgi:hypothetical protein
VQSRLRVGFNIQHMHILGLLASLATVSPQQSTTAVAPSQHCTC